MIPAPPVEASLIEYVEEACRPAEVQVRWTGVDIEVGEGDLAWEGDPCRPRPTLRLVVLDDGVVAARYTVRPALAIAVEVPVAADYARPGEPVTTEAGTAPIEIVRGRPLEGAVVARTALQPGDPVTDTVARPAPDGRAGDDVELVVRRGSLQITAPGRLLADATTGEPVRVVSEATGTTLTGTLVAPDTVVLD